MSKIQKKKISQFGKTITGNTPSSSYPDHFGLKYMFITPSDSFSNKFINTSERYLSDIGKRKLSSKLLPPKSILITCIGSAMGKIVLNKFDCVTNQQINSIVVNDLYDSDYLYYIFKKNYKLLRNASTGSTAVPILNKTDFDNLELWVHENKEDQQKIASILSDLDAKIELNNKINTELEAIAKALYDYWFVQFDFPDEDGKPYKSSGGEMVWNEELKRDIPMGWKVKTIGDLISEYKGWDWGKDEETWNYTQEVFCIRGADINGLNGKEECNPPKRFILEKNGHKLLKSYDLIVEISGGSPTQSTGRIAYVSSTLSERFNHPLICSNFCKALTLKDYELTHNFHYFWNRLYDNKILFWYEGKTSGIKNFLFDSFVDTNYIAIPNQQTKKGFFDFMENTERKRQKTLEENKKLSELRDWLLPMLMNGQVEVAM